MNASSRVNCRWSVDRWRKPQTVGLDPGGGADQQYGVSEVAPEWPRGFGAGLRADYWPLGPKARAEAARPFGRDFEKQLLLSLGAAARIYPTVWDGLATDQPTGCQPHPGRRRSPSCRESAWVLEDAGFTSSCRLVDAEGRRRARIRVKTTRPTTTGSPTVSSGHLSLDALISYQYQLSIAGQAGHRGGVAAARQRQDAAGPVSRAVDGAGPRQDAAAAPVLAAPRAERDARDAAAGSAQDRGRERTTTWSGTTTRPLQGMLARLHDKSAFAPIADPPRLQGTLRDYQRRGVAWLQLSRRASG